MSIDHTPNYGSADEINILNLQFVHVERFAFIVKTLVENGLFDEAINQLKIRGCHLLAISVEPLEVVQGMVRERRMARENADDFRTDADAEVRERIARLEQIEACACSGPKYPPRPPEHWPAGPWDPPK